MKTTRRMGFALALTLGAMTGLFSSLGGSNAAGNPYLVNNHPGATATLNCGWHSECTSGTNGNYLDWANSSPNAVYWRSISTNWQNRWAAGTIKVSDGSTGTGTDKCNRSDVRLRSPLGTDLGVIRNSHTAPTNIGTSYNVASGTFPTSTQVQVGTTVNNDCPQNYPAHLHQGQYSGAWSKNSYYPTRAECSTAECRTYTSVWNKYQHTRTWQAQY